MAFRRRLVVESDSEDELLENVYLRSRKAKRIRHRPNYFEELDDNEFFVRFRLTKHTTLYLLEKIHHDLLPKTKRNFCISPSNQLLLTLRFLACGDMLICAGDFAGVDKGTTSRIVKRVTEAIANLRCQFIKLPQNNQEIITVQEGFHRIARFPLVVGSIDCTHVKIKSPGGLYAENYRCRKGYFSINVQTVCDSNLKILDIVARWPGATHDQTIYNNSAIKAKFDSGDMGNGILLGDSGYGVTHSLIPPLLSPASQAEHLFNEAQIRTRNTVERSYGVWKRRFPILALGIRLKIDRVQAVIVACAILHNIAIDMKENIPPVDPNIAHREIMEENLRQAINNDGGNEAIRNSIIRYFSSLL